ncbi:MAG TPA: nucleotide exchange factor GrpE [Hyphomicrobiaceae bacterium]|nr:nucleotide exchange factor GrpE [Hyphomicrobiaceae bacterium]
MVNTPPNDSDPNKKSETGEPAATPQAPPQPQEANQGGAQGAAQSAAQSAAKSLQEVVAALQAEVGDLKDKYLRANAEMENIRKRGEREREEAAKYAITKLAKDIVDVGDNFQRCIDAVPPGAAERDQTLKGFLEGVTMTERELLNMLDRHGIKRLQPMNEPFNPHLHQAVTQVPRTDVPNGTIVEVYQAGFTIADRVLRPAMVGVAAGGPKPQSGPQNGPQNGSQSGDTPPANENAPPAA